MPQVLDVRRYAADVQRFHEIGLFRLNRSVFSFTKRAKISGQEVTTARSTALAASATVHMPLERSTLLRALNDDRRSLSTRGSAGIRLGPRLVRWPEISHQTFKVQIRINRYFCQREGWGNHVLQNTPIIT